MKKRKNILLIAPFPPHVGGDTISSKRLLESGYWERDGFGIERIDTSADGRVRLANAKKSWKDLLRAVRILLQLLVRLPRADIMLLWANSGFICSMGIPVMTLARMMGKPYIVKMFGVMLPVQLARSRPLQRRAVLAGLANANYLLPQTKILTSELASMKMLDRERILQFRNFLPDSCFTEDHPERKFSGRCVFMGQIKSEKGVFDIIDSIRGRTDVTCEFYGQHVDKDTDRFMREIENTPNCRYRGIAPESEVMSILGEFDLLLLPTTHPGEGYPAVILEAFAAGLTVIATRWQAIPELVDDGVTGLLVPPSSPDHIRAAIDLLAGDDRLYATLVSNASEYVRQFSEEHAIGELLIGLINRTIT